MTFDGFDDEPPVADRRAQRRDGEWMRSCTMPQRGPPHPRRRAPRSCWHRQDIRGASNRSSRWGRPRDGVAHRPSSAAPRCGWLAPFRPPGSRCALRSTCSTIRTGDLARVPWGTAADRHRRRSRARSRRPRPARPPRTPQPHLRRRNRPRELESTGGLPTDAGRRHVPAIEIRRSPTTRSSMLPALPRRPTAPISRHNDRRRGRWVGCSRVST